MQPDIIALGEPMLEFNASEEGSLAEVCQFYVGWGGDTSNFSIAASRLGGKVGYVTRLGDDDFGESFIDLWTREGVDVSWVERDNLAPTGIYFISRKGRQHYFTYYRKDSAASRMAPDFLPLEYIRGAKLLHVSGISQGISNSACDTVFAAIGAAREAGVLISYDPNLRLKLWPLERAKAVIHQTISMADLVFPSLEDAVSLTGLSDPQAIAEYYLKLGPKVVVIKLGSEGALLATGEEIEARHTVKIKKFPSYQVASSDMAGAGDTFDGAFVVGYLTKWPLDQCMRFANAAAALTTCGLGAVTPIPKREQVEALMAQQDS